MGLDVAGSVESPGIGLTMGSSGGGGGSTLHQRERRQFDACNYETMNSSLTLGLADNLCWRRNGIDMYQMDLVGMALTWGRPMFPSSWRRPLLPLGTGAPWVFNSWLGRSVTRWGALDVSDG